MAREPVRGVRQQACGEEDQKCAGDAEEAAEVDPPAEVQPLEWILLTNVPVECLEDACERIGWYECRWIIEEYHKALKTGCGVETLQFTTEDRLKPAIALLSVIALFLLK